MLDGRRFAMGNQFDFLTKSTSAVLTRRNFQKILTDMAREFGTMATQDADSVAITGGSITGTDIDVTGQTLTLDDDQIDVDKIGTSETDTSLVLSPDGAGGVEFVTTPIGWQQVYNDDLNPVFNDDDDPVYAFVI